MKKIHFLKEMEASGYLNQCTDLDKLDEICKKSISGYVDLTRPLKAYMLVCYK